MSSNNDAITRKPSGGHDNDFAMDSSEHETAHGGSGNGRTPANGQQQKSAGGSTAATGIITVQPLRRSEMQPSYAQVGDGDEGRCCCCC